MWIVNVSVIHTRAPNQLRNRELVACSAPSIPYLIFERSWCKQRLTAMIQSCEAPSYTNRMYALVCSRTSSRNCASVLCRVMKGCPCNLCKKYDGLPAYFLLRPPINLLEVVSLVATEWFHVNQHLPTNVFLLEVHDDTTNTSFLLCEEHEGHKNKG